VFTLQKGNLLPWWVQKKSDPCAPEQKGHTVSPSIKIYFLLHYSNNPGGTQVKTPKKLIHSAGFFQNILAQTLTESNLLVL
jgi:hypothetical protein